MTSKTPLKLRTALKLLTAGLAALMILGSVSTSFARGSIRQNKAWGIGITGAFNGGTGLSFKTKLGRRFALQAYGGFSRVASSNAGHVGADLLIEMPKFVGGRVLDLAWNVGLGAATTLGQYGGRWLRGVVGLELLFKPVPVDLVFEWGPALGSGGFGADHAGSHLRWWF